MIKQALLEREKLKHGPLTKRGNRWYFFLLNTKDHPQWSIASKFLTDSHPACVFFSKNYKTNSTYVFYMFYKISVKVNVK